MISMRKLATIQKVANVEPISGADNIELATILGWHCVVRKNEFKAGDLCVYFEVDSLLPPVPEFEFLAKDGIKKSYTDNKEYEGYRIRTIKLRGVVSQGLALPLSVLNEKKFFNDTRENPNYEWKEGDDVSALLGVVKYEPMVPASLSGVAKGAFPSNIPKTDETRIQEYPDILNRYKEIPFYCSEKIDGSSCTIFIENEELNICSRNLNLLESKENTYWKVAREKNIEFKLKSFGKNYAIQGELVGSNINSNHLKLTSHNIYFFNVYDIDNEKYLDYEDFKKVIESLGLETVPIVSDSAMLPPNVDDIVKMTDLKSKLNPSVPIEGLVFRPLHEIHDADLGRLSFKVLNPNYLLKFKE